MTSNDLHDTIVAREKQFVDLYNFHDAPTLAAMYTNDGQILPPGMDVVTGTANREALFQSFWKDDFTVIELDTLEVEGFGDTAYEVGRYVLSNDQHEVKEQGKYVVIWKCQMQEWKLHRDIFNATTPATN
jgi:ketosteroid isomerase-like protein